MSAFAFVTSFKQKVSFCGMLSNFEMEACRHEVMTIKKVDMSPSAFFIRGLSALIAYNVWQARVGGFSKPHLS